MILDIFASRARTYEARLQVELAQLQYFRNRLRRRWSHLERIEGGVGAGRGPGEKQIETDRRLIDRRIAELKKRLADVEKRRERTVSARREQLAVSIVGYTNAGKSTLMNALTGAEVFVADKLFATLDTRTRRWRHSALGRGAVERHGRLRPQLAAPPRRLVPLDARRGAARRLAACTSSTPPTPRPNRRSTRSIACSMKSASTTNNSVIVLNKMDMVRDRTIVDVLRRRFEDSVSISAATGDGLDHLGDVVAERLANGYVDVEIETGAGNGRLFAYLWRSMPKSRAGNTSIRASRFGAGCRRLWPAAWQTTTRSSPFTTGSLPPTNGHHRNAAAIEE